MNITKYSAIFSMAVLLSGVVAVTFSFFSEEAQALRGDKDFKKFKVKKFVCNNINFNLDGEEIFSSDNDRFPVCFNNNRN
jgi:hypothetical protein